MPEITLDQLKDLHRTLAASGETTRAASVLAIIHQHEPPPPAIPAVIREYADAREYVCDCGERGGKLDRERAQRRLEKATADLHQWLTSRPIPPQVRTLLASLDRAAFDRMACEIGGGAYSADECKELASLIRGMAKGLTR